MNIIDKLDSLWFSSFLYSYRLTDQLYKAETIDPWTWDKPKRPKTHRNIIDYFSVHYDETPSILFLFMGIMRQRCKIYFPIQGNNYEVPGH